MCTLNVSCKDPRGDIADNQSAIVRIEEDGKLWVQGAILANHRRIASSAHGYVEGIGWLSQADGKAFKDWIAANVDVNYVSCVLNSEHTISILYLDLSSNLELDMAFEYKKYLAGT